jgi:DEAD/DEAH box helicase domain-containing protein
METPTAAKISTMDINAFIEKLKRKKDIRELVHHEVIEPIGASFGECRRPLDAPVLGALSGVGIDRLYSHQVRGIELVKGGRNVVAMTPTASGKSLIYNVPVIESILKDPGTHALYIFPLKGLEQDQQGAFTELTRDLGLPGAESTRGSTPGPSAIYDGDTTQYRRKKIRENPVCNNRRDTHLPGGSGVARFASNKAP